MNRADVTPDKRVCRPNQTGTVVTEPNKAGWFDVLVDGVSACITPALRSDHIERWHIDNSREIHMTVIYDSSWPELKVNSVDEAFKVSADMNEYDNGVVSAPTFEARWGFHPEANFSIVIECKE